MPFYLENFTLQMHHTGDHSPQHKEPVRTNPNGIFASLFINF